MNKVILMGRLTADPVVVDKNEKRFLSFNIAVQKKASESADFISCMTWHNHLIEFVNNNFKKGNMIAVIGRLNTYNKTVNNVKYQAYTVDVSDAYFTGEKLMRERNQDE